MIRSPVVMATGGVTVWPAGSSGVRWSGLTQEFSNWMLTLLHASVSRPNDGATAAEPGDFAYQLGRARLQELIENPQLSRWFALAYAGVDP